MNLRTYQAHSLTEALTRIKADLGDDAVVLHSRTFKRGGMLGLGGQLVYEVTASTPAPRERRSPAARRPAPAANDTTSPPDSARAAAMALALAEQERRRRQSQEAQPVSPPTPAASPAHNGAAAASVPQSVAAGPSARRSAGSASQPAVSNGKAPNASPNATRDSKPLPVARRFVLSSGPNDAKTAEPAPQARPGKHHQDIETEAPASLASRPPAAARAGHAAPAPRPAGPAHPGLADEIATLKQMVNQVLQRQSGTLQPAMPEALFKEYVSLIQNEVAQEIADELCDVVRRELTEEQLSDPTAVRSSFRRHLARHVPIAPESTLVRTVDGRPFTIALVGPTGVGKTTTVAKLAAAFKLRHDRRVGLITTDTYRIAAVDQLRTYANIIGIPLKVALTPEEMREACESLSNCDVVLIDTAGRSPNDAARLEEIRAFATAACPHEIHLVLSSTCSEPVLMRTIERFSTVKTDRVIFTKTDEAVSLGVLINVMRKAGKELSFITTGQEVPDHIEAGSPDRLAALVLGEKG